MIMCCQQQQSRRRRQFTCKLRSSRGVSGRCTQVYSVLMKQCGGTIKTREDLQKVMGELKVGWQGGSTP